MKLLRTILFVLVATSLATIACTLPALPGKTSPTEPVIVETAIPIQEKTSVIAETAIPIQEKTAVIVFEDDFSDPESGWDSWSDETSKTDYLDGEYQILVGQENWYYWANPYRDFTDVIVDVDITKQGDPDGDAGIICRYVDASNFYFLRITTDGYYGISKIIDGEEIQLDMDELSQSSRIKTGNATNHITAECVGSSLRLLVNGREVATAEDSELTSGDVGLIGGSFDLAGVDLRFDNFVVMKP